MFGGALSFVIQTIISLGNERYDTPGQALDPELPKATRSAPRAGVSYLALPALVRIKGRTGGISRGTIPTKYPRVLLSLRLAMKI